MEDYRKHFDINSEILYFNNGTHSILPTKVRQAITKYQNEYEENPTQGLLRSWDHLWEVQKKLALHLNANPKDIFFRKNVTEPLNEFILGQPLPKDAEILTNNQEYGAVWNICRFRAEKENIKLRQFSLPNKDEVQITKKEDYTERVLSAIKPETKMLVLSEVFTGHGLVLPIKEIAKETAKKEIILVVDGAHSAGFLDLDFSQYQNVDYYGGNLHKWFLGPKGTGFGWINPKRKKELQPLQAGWITYDLNEPFLKFADGDKFATSKLMLGCQDFAPFFALSETIDFWQEQGKEEIHNRIRELGNYLTKKIKTELDLFHFASGDESCRGPLHSFLLPKKFQTMNYADIMRAILKNCQTQVSITSIDRELYLRLSAHIYNTKEEIDEISSRLKKYLLY
mgnify:CR=1 FL=1